MKPKRVRKKIPYLWVSFAGYDSDQDIAVNQGVVLIRARDLDEAIPMMRALGIVPKGVRGQIAAIQCPDDYSPPEEATNCWLTKDDIQRLMPDTELCDGHGEKLR